MVILYHHVAAMKVQTSVLLENNMIAFNQKREILLPGMLMSRYLFTYIDVIMKNLSHPPSNFLKA